ncbi:dysbindin protein homolog isoform X2 [Halyomorpha halys]|uniref:dysbindin protein homolog isoform X2 n=1 Tax=Halyomorpha halys TaxID=286706 RepID=UPI0006D528AD|nr:dysbindin protein homolog isoform X2 [Halyomorpha halys]
MGVLSRDDTSFLTHQREYLAGAHLLSKYQHDWQGIHALSEQNAAQAKTIDIQIEEVNRCIKHHWHVVKKFSSDVGDLNIILTHTEKALNEIGNIRSLIDEVYHKIVEVEDLIEEDRLTKAMSNATDNLSSFHEEKLLSMDALKEKLAEDYEIRLKVIDEEKDKLKKKSFQLAEKKFLEEINAYKESGMLPKKAEGQQLLKIEDIEIEQDLSVLQEYLDG